MSENSVYDHFDFLLYKYSKVRLETVEDINEGLDSVLLELNVYPEAPKFVITRALYSDGSVCTSGKFVIRPSVKYNLKNIDMRQSVVIINDSLFFTNFIKFVLDWIVSYKKSIFYDQKLDNLNERIKEIIKFETFPYDLTFTYGDGLLDISDNYIVIGLTSKILDNLESIGLYSDNSRVLKHYELNIINTLKECTRPYDLLKIKSNFTYDFNIYSRKSIHKLIRKFINRDIKYVRVGLGYLETSDYFGIIEKKAIHVDETSNYLDSIIEDNISATQIEIKKGLSKIAISYKLMPFEKKTNIFTDIRLQDFLKMNEESEG